MSVAPPPFPRAPHPVSAGGSCRAPLSWATPALLLALAACGPRAEAPVSGIAPPARFVEAAQSEARWPAPDWWRGFDSAALDDLMLAAAEGNFDLGVAAARVRQADAQLRIVGAALLPQVDVGGSAGRSRSPNLVGNNTARGRNSYGLSLQASYEIDVWNRLGSQRDAAAADARAARFNVGAVALTTQASVANTFFDALRARAELAVQEENIAAARRVLTVVRAQVAAGTATGLDLAQQETALAQQETAVPPLRQAIAQNTYALATLTGRTPDAIALDTAGFDRLRVPPVAPGLPVELLDRRPDVLLAEANLEAASADVAAARAALLPTVGISGQLGLQSLGIGTLVQPERLLYSLVASVAQYVFDGGARRGQVELSQARREELLLEYRRAIVSALEDVESSLVALRETGERLRQQEETVVVAARAFAIAEAQLRAGTINLITLINTQANLFSARTAVVQARLANLQAAVGLFRALGGGWR